MRAKLKATASSSLKLLSIQYPNNCSLLSHVSLYKHEYDIDPHVIWQRSLMPHQRMTNPVNKPINICTYSTTNGILSGDVTVLTNLRKATGTPTTSQSRSVPNDVRQNRIDALASSRWY